VRRYGLLVPQQQTGLLGEPMQPQDKPSYDQTMLRGQAAEQNFSTDEYRRRYIAAMEAQQRQRDQQALERAAIKGGKKYLSDYDLGTGTAGNATAAQQGYGSLDHANYNDVANTIDDAGGAEATNQDAGSGGGGSGGSYLGAATGALGGYSRGKKNYYTDPAMRSGEDGYGRYHRDYRAEIGGGILGGVLGYYAPYASGAAGPIVEWIHPYMQDMTRDVINFGDRIGGVTGAMLLDPIGAYASGKYSNKDILTSGLLAPLGPLNALIGGGDDDRSTAERVLDPGGLLDW
jgi:hypothetical protein